MEIFLDTAKIEEIRHAAELGIITGVTTNPTLMMRAGTANYKAVVQEICYIVQGHISAEVTSLKAEEMVEQAKEIAQWSPYVAVKIPVCEEGLKAINRLASLEDRDLELIAEKVCTGCPWLGKCYTPLEEARDIVRTWGVRTNATLVFSANQGLLAALAGASYVSPFIGRLDDAGHEGMEVVAELAEIFEKYGFETAIIAASIRHPRHITEAALAGADIATVPYDVLMKAIQHHFTDVGIKRFMEDWEKVKGARP